MDAAETFRYLLTNKSIPDEGINVGDFVFQTVFYKCGPSYCICRCAYDHEFLSYVSDNGDVDVGILDTLTTAIKDGYCQHASKVTDKRYFRETGISINHIAAALDSEEMSRAFISGYHSGEINIRKIYSELFQIHPIHISVLKGNALVAPMFANYQLNFIARRWNNEVIHAHEGEINVIRVEKAPVLELCISRDLKMVDLLLKNLDPAQRFLTRERIYELLFKHNLPDTLNAILDRIIEQNEWRSTDHPYVELDDDDLKQYKLFVDVPSILKLAVMYNQRDMFDKSLQLLSQRWTSSYGNPLPIVRDRECDPLIMVCEAFNWEDNHKRVLQKESQNLKEDRSTKNKSIFVYLYGLLTQYISSGLQIKHAMEQLPDIRKLINAPFDVAYNKYKYVCEGLTPLQSYVSRDSSYNYLSRHTMVSMEVVRTLLELGADTDTVFPLDLVVFNFSIAGPVTLPGGQSLILHLCIINEDDDQKWRHFLELLLYENVSMEMNKTVVGFGLKYYKDQILHNIRKRIGTTSKRNFKAGMLTRTYIMDAKLHESALDFAVPLLIEAGFDYSHADIKDAINLPIDPSSDDEQVETQRHGIGSGGPFPLEKILVLEYLQKCLDGPRPLTCLCRTVLRKHFPRRQIHRYVSSVIMSKKVKDYLLLRPLLQRLPDDIQISKHMINQNSAR